MILVNNTNNHIFTEFNNNYDDVILDDPDDYCISVARMDLSILDLALFDFATEGPFVISIRDPIGGAVGSATLVFPPNLTTSSLPFIRNLNDFLTSINTGFAAAVVAFNAAPGPHAALTQTPHMEYESKTQTLSLWAQNEYWEDQSPLPLPPNNPVEIWWNWNLYRRFNDFMVFFQGFNRTDFLDVRMKILDRFNNNVTTPDATHAAAGVWHVMYQEKSFTSSLLDLKSIIVTTTSIPVNTEYITSSGTTTQGTIRPIITDFIPINDPNTSILPLADQRLQYFPPFYRLTDLVGKKELRQIDIKVFISTTDGILFPLLLAPQQSSSIKLAFIRKKLSN